MKITTSTYHTTNFKALKISYLNMSITECDNYKLIICHKKCPFLLRYINNLRITAFLPRFQTEVQNFVEENRRR
jgi:hypothetical protein